MKILRRVFLSLVLVLCSNLVILRPLLAREFSLELPTGALAAIACLCALSLIWIACRPLGNLRPAKRLCALDRGCELLRLFLISAALNLAAFIYITLRFSGDMFPLSELGFSGTFACWLFNILTAVLCESAVFWAGMLRLYFTSVQLGIKHRVLGLVCGWIPGLNIYYLTRLIHTVEAEVELESEKLLLDSLRAESGVCRTKYPILLVHGVFFRDFRYLNYWGRIPAELRKNGAAIYYGEQQSAASVEACGGELAERIGRLVRETGCEKVNIIAHSKGGLDSRAAISHFGAAPCVASLTTINTPHRGCLFAEYLLSKIPEKARNALAKTYNTALKKLGDHAPDFLLAVGDLTASACEERNKNTPDAAGVLYESVMSYCQKAGSGKFPLNVSYPLVKHFDGKNDGLVSVDSARWGESFTLLTPPGNRGISHADMIDLNRENIPGFDVREFYVGLVSRLKERGL